MNFFISCDPPRATSQGKRLAVVKGKPMFFKNKQGEAAGRTYEALLAPHAPQIPVPGPVRLCVTVVWPWRKCDMTTKAAKESCSMHGARKYFMGKPDCDNYIKQLQDVLVTMRFINADQEVSELYVRKFVGSEPGVYIDITTLD